MIFKIKKGGQIHGFHDFMHQLFERGRECLLEDKQMSKYKGLISHEIVAYFHPLMVDFCMHVELKWLFYILMHDNTLIVMIWKCSGVVFGIFG